MYVYLYVCVHVSIYEDIHVGEHLHIQTCTGVHVDHFDVFGPRPPMSTKIDALDWTYEGLRNIWAWGMTPRRVSMQCTEGARQLLEGVF